MKIIDFQEARDIITENAGKSVADSKSFDFDLRVQLSILQRLDDIKEILQEGAVRVVVEE